MAYQVTHERRAGIRALLPPPESFTALVEAQYQETLKDPTREVVITAGDEEEARTCLAWAKQWGNARTEPLEVLKVPNRKGASAHVVRLAIRPRTAQNPRRGPKGNAGKGVTPHSGQNK